MVSTTSIVSTHTRTHPSIDSPIKRTIDILGSCIGLTILGVLLLPIAVAIAIDSPGPVFYSQIRHGLYGRTFKIWKFRSMVDRADIHKNRIANETKGLMFKNKSDPRVTRVGKLLRKTSIDEFPQFWNVLMGDMSLVGTRPPTSDEVKHYSLHHWRRLSVKPGITGEWQVHGRSRVKSFEDVVELDLRYQRRWTPFYDVVLIVKTVYVMLFDRSGAY
jgi:lipopolysaccharide/colanic/teichoic acid biosynthesis glycosyltransferase